MPELYDPYLASSDLPTPRNHPTSSQQPPRNTRVAAVQAQIDETVGVMRENITRVAERQERLEDLEARAESLAATSQAFRRNADRVRKNMWWQDMKMRIIIGITIAVIITILIISIVQAVKKHKASSK